MRAVALFCVFWFSHKKLFSVSIYVYSIMLFQFCFLALVMVGVSAQMGGIAGGWSVAAPNSVEVVGAANFAVKSKFPSIQATFEVVYATKQVIVNAHF